MKIVYKADDGNEFDTVADCQKYEQTQHKQKLLDGFLIDHLVDFADRVWLRDFLLKHSNSLVEILTGANKQKQSEWISNEGRELTHPPICLSGSDKVEVIFRSGLTSINRADTWFSNWRTVDNKPFDIVSYRKI